MIDRRQFLGRGLAAGLAGLTAGPLASRLAAAETDADWSGAFKSALARDPRLLGWRNAGAEALDCAALELRGRLPAALEGTFYRNGPALHERFGQRYRHWFEGDGMLQAFRIGDGRIAHRGRVLRTPKLAREDAAGRRLYHGFYTRISDPEPIRRPDDINVANISVLDHNGDLMALWEGGSASRVDRESLQWTGFKSWGEGLAGLPFTAHPKVEPDGTLWAFGYVIAPKPVLVLYHIGADGGLRKATPVALDAIGMVHDFVVTGRHLVIVHSPYVIDRQQRPDATFLSSHVWKPERGTRVLIVSKDDFEDRRWAQLPAGFGFHHGNGWEEADGTIRFDHCVARAPDLVHDTLSSVMRGELKPATPERYSQFTIRPDGRTDVMETDQDAEFPRIAPSRVGSRNRFVYMLGAGPELGWGFNRLIKRDVDSGAQQVFDYGPGILAEEHIFVPHPDARSEDHGWLLGTFLNYGTGVTGLSVFDARAPQDGPLARGLLPYPLPLGFHGQFSAA